VEHLTLTEPKRPSMPGGAKPAGTKPAGSTSPSRRPSSSPTGTRRAGRRDITRRRYDEPTLLERFRTPLLVTGVVAVVAVVGFFVFTSASEASYSCTTIDTVQPAPSGELGQVQPDMGNTHVARGTKVAYPVCPPASGKHINQPPYGPIPPKVYGPDDQVVPNGWIHNLEHGGLVLLYSCDKGACEAEPLAQLQEVWAGFPASPVCGIPPGSISPVIARFEQMPTKYAVLVWDRVMYLDELDIAQVYEFYTRYSERVDGDGNWLAPPEPQCAAPSPSAPAGESPSAGASPSAATSPSGSAAAPTSPSAAPSPSSS
jgi:hypothetical protein